MLGLVTQEIENLVGLERQGGQNSKFPVDRSWLHDDGLFLPLAAPGGPTGGLHHRLTDSVGPEAETGGHEVNGCFLGVLVGEGMEERSEFPCHPGLGARILQVVLFRKVA